MTEQQAKEKWCPMARIGWNEGGAAAINRHPMDDHGDGEEGAKPYTRCLGSGCMMWRSEGIQPNAQAKNGYCGLAKQ